MEAKAPKLREPTPEGAPFVYYGTGADRKAQRQKTPTDDIADGGSSIPNFPHRMGWLVQFSVYCARFGSASNSRVADEQHLFDGAPLARVAVAVPPVVEVLDAEALGLVARFPGCVVVVGA